MSLPPSSLHSPGSRSSRLAIVGAAVALVVTVGGTVGRFALTGRPSPGWRLPDGLPALATSGLVVAIAAAVVAALALLLIDARPRLGMATVAVAATLAWIALPWPPPTTAIPYAIAIVLAVRRGAATWAIGAIVGSLVVTVSVIAAIGGTRGLIVGAVMTCVALTIVLVVSLGRRSRIERTRIALAHAEEQGRTQAARERADMARELHDVLAHSLSSISVQANVALHLADREPERATQALATIRDTSRRALDDVRHMLGVLRGEADGPLVPEADLDALPAIAADAEAMGIAVELDDGLTPRPSTAIQSALVRIVREALTNAARHAPGSAVRVTLSRAQARVVATIVDGGAAVPRQATAQQATSAAGPAVGPAVGTAVGPAQTGRGIVGMRERATLLGGTLDAAPHGAGFAVVATIPEAP